MSVRKDVLSALFGLLALIAYVRFARKGSRRAYAASLVCTILANAAKATWVALPALFLLLDYWPLRRFGPGAPECAPVPEPAVRRTSLASLFGEKLPFVAVAAAGPAWAITVQAPLGASAVGIPIRDPFLHAV